MEPKLRLEHNRSDCPQPVAATGANRPPSVHRAAAIGALEIVGSFRVDDRSNSAQVAWSNVVPECHFHLQVFAVGEVVQVDGRAVRRWPAPRFQLRSTSR